MTDDEIIAVVQAHRDGKQIEFRFCGGGNWHDAPDPEWNFSHRDYRVAGEPRFFWLCNGKDRKNFVVVDPEEHDTGRCGGEMIKVQEVLE